MITVLDQRKDEAIERTFKQVAKYFSEVFEKLVPAGHGQLIMQRRIDRVSNIFFLFYIFRFMNYSIWQIIYIYIYIK